MLKFTLKYLTFAATCFGPFGPSSGSSHWAWLKLHFCRNNQQKYTVISVAVLWQHVFQVVVCVLDAVQRATARHPVHTPHAAATMHYL